MTTGGFGAFGYDDDGIQAPCAIARTDRGRYLFQIEIDFRDQDGVGTAGDARVQRDPTGIASHHLHYHHALMAFRRAVQPVYAFGGEGHCRVEAEGGEGLVQVVVDRLGHADDAQAFEVQGIGDGEGSVAADRHERIQFLLREEFQDLVRAIHILRGAVRHFHRKMQGIALVGRAEDRASLACDSAHLFAREAEHTALGIAFREQDAVESFADAVAFPATVGGADDHGADDCVEARGIAAAGADGDASDVAGHENPCVKR